MSYDQMGEGKPEFNTIIVNCLSLYRGIFFKYKKIHTHKKEKKEKKKLITEHHHFIVGSCR